MNKRYLLLSLILLIIEGLFWCMYPNVGDAQEYGDLFTVCIFANGLFLIVVLPVTVLTNVLILTLGWILDDRIKIFKIGIIMQSICLLVNLALIPASIYAANELFSYGMQGFSQYKIDAVIRKANVHSLMAWVSLCIVVIEILLIVKYAKELILIKKGMAHRWSKRWRDKYEYDMND